MTDVALYLPQQRRSIWPALVWAALIAGTVAIALHPQVANWAANGDVVFVEYEMSGTLAGQPLSWTGIGRFKLRGERAIDAIGRWDNLDLLARIDPSVRVTAFAEAAASLVVEAGG